MENPLERIQKAKSEEAQQSEQSFEFKLEKVNSELLKLPEYKSRADFLKQEKQKVSEALETKDDPQIEAERGNLEKYLTDLENELNPLKSRINTLTNIEHDKNVEVTGIKYMALVEEVESILDGTIPETELVAKNSFYNTWSHVTHEGQAKGGDYTAIQNDFPKKFYEKLPKVDWGKYYKEMSGQFFQVPKDIPANQAYPWKEAMKISKRYWQESSEGGAEAFKRDVLNAKL